VRIAVVASSYPRFPGDGTAPFVKSIAEHMARLGHDVELVAPYDPDVQPMEMGSIRLHRFRYVWPKRLHIMGHARSLSADVQLRPLAFALLPLFLLGSFITLMRVTGRQKSHGIHAHWVLPNGLVGAWVASLRRIPLVISLHGSDIFVAQRNRIFRWVTRSIFRRAALVTACSKDLKRGAVDIGCDPAKIHVIAWGADPDRFHPGIAPLDRLAFGLTGNEAILVTLGRMVPKKGFDILVRALALLVPSYPHVHLLIGGDGVERDSLQRLAKELEVSDHLHMPGRILWDQVPHFLAMGDVFVLPSVRDEAGNLDGLPTVLPEAMACGKPVVASRIAGIPLAIEDGCTGILVPPGDVKALAGAISSLLADPMQRSALGVAARIRVERELNWLQVARFFASLFERVLRE